MDVDRVTALVKNNTDSGMTHFCDIYYTSPELARAGSQALIVSFDDSGLWLAGLVQPAHLLAELRQHCCTLTRVVITQWTRQGEVHKLVRLAEALMAAQPAVLSHEAGQIMALLASLLGILRPEQAVRWLNASLPLLRDSVDPHLLKEARQWVNLGQMLSSLPPEDRYLWNRRLRDAEHAWDWDSPEPLEALRRIRPILAKEPDATLLFQITVPRCWWDLWREQQDSLPATPAPPTANGGRATPFLVGLFSGMVCMAVALGMAASWFSWGPMGRVEEGSAPTSYSFRPVKSKSRGATPPPLESPAAASPAMQTRLAEAAKIAEDLPQLAKVHPLVKTGSMAEAMPYIQGSTSLVAQGTKEHRALLRWLMLDPPVDPATRQQVAKAAVRVLGGKEMYATLMLCLHPGSPNAQEAQEAADLLLDLNGEDLSAVERYNLLNPPLAPAPKE